ncbi:16S rRNA (adenine(1518)-N(6)/adenine(1519)-N(6))-dimethyltransferase [Bacterioplanes sanyensis]|uniref:Ribosomal RNA small subunit methyltransferase A n=1 Tax=Bacterioplanes sanyensis TaxID=1249553 RepID=A0A222FP31_9GAMM|nr:16S rRNA (adenine(1518)-N(6)/adenine(1519)-N(6))-dimethyltransferase [Bacterioplanes sanyensis]
MPKAHGHKARKRFGQNFLHDQHVIDKIIRAIHPKDDDRLVEIGPGIGAITEPLLEATGRLDVVELDRDLIPILRTKFFNFPDFTIHEGDALKFDFSQIAGPQQALRIVGNLPYNISTPLIFHLLSHHQQVQDMHFMLQKEVVDRLAAAPGSSDYGRLGIMAQYYCRVEPLFIVGPGSFNPPPKVDSAIVRLVPHQTLPHPAKDVKILEQVVRSAFSMRRKTLRNTLKTLIDADQLSALGIDPTLRPERITLEQYVCIADAISANGDHNEP